MASTFPFNIYFEKEKVLIIESIFVDLKLFQPHMNNLWTLFLEIKNKIFSTMYMIMLNKEKCFYHRRVFSIEMQEAFTETMPHPPLRPASRYSGMQRRVPIVAGCAAKASCIGEKVEGMYPYGKAERHGAGERLHGATTALVRLWWR